MNSTIARSVNTCNSNMSSFIGYINNAVIKLRIYFSSHMGIVKQIININSKRFHAFIWTVVHTNIKMLVLFLCMLISEKNTKDNHLSTLTFLFLPLHCLSTFNLRILTPSLASSIFFWGQDLACRPYITWLTVTEYLCHKLPWIFGFPIFRFWAYPMKFIPETRRAH